MLPISTLLEGEYGVSNVALSVPAILGSDGVEAVLELPLSSNEILELHHSSDTLEATFNELGL